MCLACGVKSWKQREEKRRVKPDHVPPIDKADRRRVDVSVNIPLFCGFFLVWLGLWGESVPPPTLAVG